MRSMLRVMLAQATGGGGGGCGVVLATPYDDNFDCGSAIDTAGTRFSGANAWTQYGVDVNYAGGVLTSGQLVMSVTSSGTYVPRGAYQTAPSGDWAFETDCSVGTGANPSAGIRLSESATSKEFSAHFTDSGGLKIAAGDGSSLGVYGSAVTGVLSGKIEVARISGNLRLRYDIGSGWVTLVASLAQTTPFTTAPDQVGVYHSARRDGGGSVATFNYFYKTA